MTTNSNIRPARSDSKDQRTTVLTIELGHRLAQGMPDVLYSDPMLEGAVSDIHTTRLPCRPTATISRSPHARSLLVGGVDPRLLKRSSLQLEYPRPCSRLGLVASGE